MSVFIVGAAGLLDPGAWAGQDELEHWATEESAEYVQDHLHSAALLLAAVGCPVWSEPTDGPAAIWTVSTEALLDLLARAARLTLRTEEPPAGEPFDPWVLIQAMPQEPTHGLRASRHRGDPPLEFGRTDPGAYNHLPYRAGESVVYSPLTLVPPVVSNTVSGGMVGSAPQLINDLDRLAPLLVHAPQLTLAALETLREAAATAVARGAGLLVEF